MQGFKTLKIFWIVCFGLLSSKGHAIEVNSITYDWLVDLAMYSEYTDHVPHFKRLFNTIKVRGMLECGCGYATKFFLDHCEKVVSIEFFNPGNDDLWFMECLKLYEDCLNWIPIAYNYDHANKSFNNACGYQCTAHQDYALIDARYMVSLKRLFKDHLLIALEEGKEIDVAFVDPGVYIRGDMVKVLLELEVPIVIAHDTSMKGTTDDDLYGWTKVKTPSNYEMIMIPSGKGTTFWINKQLPHVIASITAYRDAIVDRMREKGKAFTIYDVKDLGSDDFKVVIGLFDGVIGAFDASNEIGTEFLLEQF